MSDKTRNEWQKRWLLSPYIALCPHISPFVPIWNCFVIFHPFFINYLNQLLNQLWFLTQYYLSTIFGNLYTIYNLLFPRRSCSIGFPYPLESIHPVRKPNVVILPHLSPYGSLVGHFTDFDFLRKSQRASFLRTISVKSGFEPVLLCRSNYTSTGWLTTSTPLIVLKKQGNPKVCQKIQVYKGTVSNIWQHLETNFKQN
jgi:hypothetical protein